MTIAKGRVLVTGGAGFIGSHLCERLLNDGYDVQCVDNYYSSTKDNISHLMGNPRFEVIRHDVTFPLYVEVDEIYHLACPASPVHYQRDPVQTTKTAVHGSINMLGLAKRTEAKILLTSTSEVYGDPVVHPQNEDYWGNVNPIGPRACYDEGKRCAETLFFDYHRQHNLSIKVVRLFNTYGPRMHPQDGRVVSNFIVQALALTTLFLRYAGRRWAGVARGRPGQFRPDGSRAASRLLVAGVLVLTPFPLALQLAWAAGSGAGLDGPGSVDSRVVAATHACSLLLAVAGTLGLAWRRPRRLPLAAPLGAAWLGSGATLCWALWMLLPMVTGAAADQTSALPLLVHVARTLVGAVAGVALLGFLRTRTGQAGAAESV